MAIGIAPRHTRAVEAVETAFGTLIREDYYQYPRHESNLYMVDSGHQPVWFAERAMEDDAYANPIRRMADDKIKCASWNGFDCEIDLRTGKLVHAAFTK
jgi:hypothetical protein